MELVIDAETHDPNISLGKGAGWVFKDFEVLGFSVKCDKEPSQFLTNVGEVRDLVKKSRTLICHNATYDIGCLHRLDIPYQDKTIIDTLILMKLYDNSIRNYSLDSISWDFLGVRKDTHKLEEISKSLKLKGDPRSHMKIIFQNFPEVIKEYAIKDTDLTRRIYDWLMRELYQQGKDLIPFYSTLIKAITKSRARGVRVSKEQAIRSGDALDEMFEIEMHKFSHYCPNVNIESTKQLSYAFRSLGLVPGTTESGNDSIDAEWRSNQDHPAVEALSKAKKYQKLRRDFIDGVIERSENERIYPEINILGATETGRFSSSNPNIQQCYDDETEVLTEKRGWVLFKDLMHSDKVASWKEGAIKFTDYSNPVSYIAEYINIFSSRTNRINMAVTDDHRCLRMRSDGKLDVYSPKEHSKEWLHLRGGIWNDNSIRIFPEFIDLVFAIHAIGILHPKRGVDFFICGVHKAQRLLAACKTLAIDIQKVSKFATGALHLFIDIKSIPPAVWRYINPDTKELTEKVLLFARESILDHVRTWYGEDNKKASVVVKNKKSADMLQAVISISNSSCTISEFSDYGNKRYNMCLDDLFYSDTLIAKVERKSYNKRVYCVEVPSTFLLTRRHGSTSISGNCPSRDTISNEFIKTLFLPEEGEKWYSLDFSSQEPRIQLAYAFLAHSPGADILRQSFVYDNQHDLHLQVADICQITRKEAKTINLAISYGMSQSSVAKKMKVSKGRTSEIFKKYKTLIPYLSHLNHEVQSAGLRKGYIKTLLGRRLLLDKNFPYKALNKLVQGAAADMTSICLVKAYEKNLPVLFSVHDSIELSSSKKFDAIEMKNIMENSFKESLPIPFYTEIKDGYTWGTVA